MQAGTSESSRLDLQAQDRESDSEWQEPFEILNPVPLPLEGHTS